MISEVINIFITILGFLPNIHLYNDFVNIFTFYGNKQKDSILTLCPCYPLLCLQSSMTWTDAENADDNECQGWLSLHEIRNSCISSEIKWSSEE